eukprot:15349915-Heterocapsa_arctica.AAC.1
MPSSKGSLRARARLPWLSRGAQKPRAVSARVRSCARKPTFCVALLRLGGASRLPQRIGSSSLAPWSSSAPRVGRWAARSRSQPH